MKKHLKLVIAVAVILAVAAAGVTGYFYWQNQKQYHATYIIIDDVEYLRASTSLDLSGKTLTEKEKLQELTALETLDLRDTGITPEDYEQLCDALPNCTIRWSVPFQDTYLDNDIQSLTLTHLSQSDMDTLNYFPRLEEIWALECTDYEALMALRQARPELLLNYKVTIGGKAYINYATSLTIADLDMAEFREKIGYLPQASQVRLEGTLPDLDELAQLRSEYSGITFDYDFEVFGISVNSLDEFLDLSGMKFESVEEVEKILPYFCDMKKIDMVDCGFSNDTMDALNKRNLGTKFVWKVSVCGMLLRTDAKYFMPVKYKLKDVSSYGCRNLRYCTDIEALDFGHYGISNVDFVQYMPKLKYLLLCDGRVSDLTAISKCTSLEFLEMFSTLVTDYWPLTNLTNLKDLNLGGTPCQIDGDERDYGPFGDYTPLLQMTWLDRLWIPYTFLDKQTRTTIQDALPNTMILFNHTSMTGGGFRFTPKYFEQRDVMGMYYGAN